MESSNLKISIEAPNNLGQLTLNFSQDILLVRDVVNWSSENEGKKYLDIQYKPSTESEALIEETGS